MRYQTRLCQFRFVISFRFKMLKHPVHLYIDFKSTRQILPSYFPNILMRLPCIVLAERRDEKGNEPYTWVREAGKGRVFYTAWGHDQRTWSNPQFVALIDNGIRWAASSGK